MSQNGRSSGAISPDPSKPSGHYQYSTLSHRLGVLLVAGSMACRNTCFPVGLWRDPELDGGSESAEPHGSPWPPMSTVLDVNDETPTFFPAVYNVSVSEDVPRDFRVLWLNCTDNDIGLNAELSYFITGAPHPGRGWVQRPAGAPNSSGDREKEVGPGPS